MQLQLSILVDRQWERATITPTCRNKFQASNAIIPVPLGELFKHRLLLGGHCESPGWLPEVNGGGSKATRGLVGVIETRTKQEPNPGEFSGKYTVADGSQTATNAVLWLAAGANFAKQSRGLPGIATAAKGRGAMRVSGGCRGCPPPPLDGVFYAQRPTTAHRRISTSARCPHREELRHKIRALLGA